MEYLQRYWIFILITAFLLYRFVQRAQIKKQLPKLRQEGAVMIDVRSKDEFDSGHAPETINIPLGELKSRLHEIDRTKPIVLCCATGTRSAMARTLLKQQGIRHVYNMGSWMNLMRS